MTRNEKILKHIDKNGKGLEVGPSHNPIAPKKDGYNVEIIDHNSREELLIKYKDHSINSNNIEEVDFVWKGESYADLTGKKKHYDWIIASHLIEHTPDLIGFLKDCDDVLKDDGKLIFVVPDKRYCFDHFRPITGISKIIDSYYSKNKIHSPGTVAEYYLNVVSKNGTIAWGKDVNAKWSIPTKTKYKLLHSYDDAINGMEFVNKENRYIDVHSWCFVPHSFRLLIHDLFNLSMIPFKEMKFYPTDGCEFIIILSHNGMGINKTRQEMLIEIDKELRKI